MTIMDISWNLQVLLTWIACIPSLFAVILQINHYQKTKYRASLYWAIFYLSNFGLMALFALAEMFLSHTLFILSVYCLIPFTFSISLAYDALQREWVDPRKLTLFGFLGSAIIISGLLPGATIIEPNIMGDLVVKWAGYLRLTGSISNLAAGILLTQLVGRAYKETRKSVDLIKPGRLLLIGVVCIWIAIILAGLRILGHQILSSIAVVVWSITFYFYPKLFFLLPFKVLRLIVIHNQSGIPIYTYTWKSGVKLADETLFSGMVQGIGMIMRESMNRGEIREIRLVEGVLLLHAEEESPITCSLASTRSSRILHEALAHFLKRFSQEFAQSLEFPNEINQFKSAVEIVEECFSFIPEFKE